MRKFVTLVAIMALILVGVLLLRKTGESIPGEKTTSKSVKQNQGRKIRVGNEQGLQKASRNRFRNEIIKQRAWVPEELSASLSAGGIEVAVAFESESSSELQKAIIHDLNLIFGHLESHEYLDSRGRRSYRSTEGCSIQTVS
jgi:hypothetical protein